MNKKIKNKFIALISCMMLFVGISSYADDQMPVNNIDNQQPCKTKIMHCKYWRHHHRHFDLGLSRNKNLSEGDAKIIIQAALLMQGRKDLHVAEAKTTPGKHGHVKYRIQIDNQANQVVSTVVVSSATGHVHPVRNVDAPKTV